MPYALDLAVLPIRAVVIAVDCWGEAPLALEVVERSPHHIVGRTADGRSMFAGAPLVRRMATEEEAAAFRPSPKPALPAVAVSMLPPSPPKQMELF